MITPSGCGKLTEEIESEYSVSKINQYINIVAENSPTRNLKFTNNGGKYLLATNDKGDLIIYNVNEARIFALKSTAE